MIFLFINLLDFILKIFFIFNLEEILFFLFYFILLIASHLK
jgi:hypothetical protein